MSVATLVLMCVLICIFICFYRATSASVAILAAVHRPTSFVMTMRLFSVVVIVGVLLVVADFSRMTVSVDMFMIVMEVCGSMSHGIVFMVTTTCIILTDARCQNFDPRGRDVPLQSVLQR